METKKVEENILIGTRKVGFGDTWQLVGEDIEYPSLTDFLEVYFQKTNDKCHFRLEPLNSKIFAIKFKEEEIPQSPPKHFNIYGED
jgi:hypothetical protein